MTEPWHVHYLSEGLTVQTDMLAEHGQAELRVTVPDRSLLLDAEAFLRWVVNYLQECDARIAPGETVTHGYWVVKFDAAPDGYLDAWEYAADGQKFVPGATLSLTYWREQQAVCDRLGAEFTPPFGDSLALVDEQVFAGEPIRAVRWPPPRQGVSGWWIGSRDYAEREYGSPMRRLLRRALGRFRGQSGAKDPMHPEHLYHLTARRPELAPYLALPPGYCLELGDHERVWFEPHFAATTPDEEA